ncbi:Flp pilus assembly protein TadB [hydrothermal vent metagenome]|uniref:Flp pilus assembly protein TadB n=1 Tax=hydrothermal vent metagenome TaxID=652676 RepID=A0A3B0RA16_9ZZZZ
MADMTFILVAVLAFVSIAGVGWVFAGGSENKVNAKRVKTLGAGDGRRKKKISSVDLANSRRKQVQETLKDLEAHQKEQRKQSISLKAQIEQAGLSWSPTGFWIGNLVVGCIIFGLLVFTGRPILIAAGLGVGGGFGLPRWVLGFLRKRRMKKFSKEFANAIDIIVRGVKSGLPLNECLQIIGRESPDPVGPEFKQLVEGQTVGVDLPVGLEKMFTRMPLPELNFFAIVLTIQQKTGGNLAEALENLANVLRARKRMREKIQAMSSEAKASSMIIGSLPPLVGTIVYFTTPAYMSLMFTETNGQLMLAGGAFWMASGIFVMKKMINFDI